ncbi:MAG: putative peptidoglycan glycosyltransferase FtsW [Patescibacteria group bacterium]
MKKELKIDRIFLISVLLLSVAGFFLFTSASLGLLARDGASFQNVALKQLIGLVLGAGAFFLMSKTPYKFLRKNAFYIFIGAYILNLLLFIPGLAQTHGGASRWIDLGFVTFQPSEFLKIAFIIYLAAWLSGVKEKVTEFKMSVVPYFVILSFLGILLLVQSDTDTLAVIALTGLIMLFSSGAKIRHLAVIVLFGICALGAIIYARPYVRDRVMTYLNPGASPQGSGYQIQQSLLAIGSGKFFGRGFGQSIQKFNYLPEPIGDSIFAVQAEEFGFVGSVGLLALFLLFLFRSMKIAGKAPDSFGGLVVLGIAILIIVESFMNISSMLGIIPLSGMPLLFVSHGGTALIITLGAAGIIANVSKHTIH